MGPFAQLRIVAVEGLRWRWWRRGGKFLGAGGSKRWACCLDVMNVSMLHYFTGRLRNALSNNHSVVIISKAHGLCPCSSAAMHRRYPHAHDRCAQRGNLPSLDCETPY